MEESTTRSGRPIRPVRAIMADMVSQDEVKQLIEAARNQLIADLTSQNRLLPSGGTSTAAVTINFNNINIFCFSSVCD